MAGDGWRTRAGLRVIVVIAVMAGLVAPAAGQSTIVLGVDVARFSERAAAWSVASAERRAADLVRAEELGREAAAEEAERAAAEAAAQAAREAAARAATTTTTTMPAPTTTAAPAVDDPSVPTTAPPTTTAPAPGGPTAEQWAALRACESGGRYDAVSPSGRYRGAYQFSQATWDWVASWAQPALVGVDPAAASVPDQDTMALALYGRQGSSPWPHCGVHLT